MAGPIPVMISSRNATVLTDGTTLTELRRRIKGALQAQLERPDGELRISVWINEDSEAAEGSSDWYDESMARVRAAAIVLVLFSGVAGSVPTGRTIGICHAELQAALDDAPTKIRAIDVRSLVADGAPAARPTDVRFVAAFEDRHLLTRRPATVDAAVDDAVDAIGGVIHDLALAGITSARRGRRALGAALDWRRMTFAVRKAAMEEALVAAMVDAGGERLDPGRPHVRMEVAGEQVLMVAGAAPEGLSLAASRELVGQPHRNDHLLADALRGASGPVHVLACPAGVTAQQMRTLMGATELVTAVTSTGIWAADTVSRGQVLALGDCIDATGVQIHLEAALDWLRRSGEDAELVKRARRRRAIVEQVAAPDDP